VPRRLRHQRPAHHLQRPGRAPVRGRPRGCRGLVGRGGGRRPRSAQSVWRARVRRRHPGPPRLHGQGGRAVRIRAAEGGRFAVNALRRTLLFALCAPTIALAQATHTQYPGKKPATEGAQLRVCADPNNLPFSNRAGQGFENELAGMLAKSMGKTVSYTWAAQQKQFLRDTLDAGKCDVVIGLPTDDHAYGVLTTHPYYRSTYALVYRADAPYKLASLDNPRLRKLTIGVHSIGDDWADLPGGAVLAYRGIVDVAIAWGPLAGYFATREPVKLTVVPLTHTHAVLPFQFSISMAVRHGDAALRDRLDAFVQSHRGAIHTLLARYGVPQLPMQAGKPDASERVTER